MSAPLDVQIFEDGRPIGTNLSDRIMVSAGRHEIEIVNEAVGSGSTRTLQVAAGSCRQRQARDAERHDFGERPALG